MGEIFKNIFNIFLKFNNIFKFFMRDRQESKFDVFITDMYTNSYP